MDLSDSVVACDIEFDLHHQLNELLLIQTVKVIY